VRNTQVVGARPPPIRWGPSCPSADWWRRTRLRNFLGFLPVTCVTWLLRWEDRTSDPGALCIVRVMHTKTWCVVVSLSLQRAPCEVDPLALRSGIPSYLADVRILLSFLFHVVGHFVLPRSLEFSSFDLATPSPFCLFVCLPALSFPSRAVADTRCSVVAGGLSDGLNTVTSTSTQLLPRIGC